MITAFKNKSLARATRKAIESGRRTGVYWLQKTTGYGIDYDFEKELVERTDRYLRQRNTDVITALPSRDLAAIELSDSERYRLVRDDIYKRFVACDTGIEFDEFGRRGHWVPRGCRIFFDTRESVFIKIFDEYFCRRGEGRFLESAIKKNVYEFLCPALDYLVKDHNNHLRGYAIASGQVLTPFEFERYVSCGLRKAICEITKRSGLYFYDLICHNCIRIGDQISFIDLESVLPLEWYGQDKVFSLSRLDDIDIGFPIQNKFHSPKWYAAYLEGLNLKDGDDTSPVSN